MDEPGGRRGEATGQGEQVDMSSTNEGKVGEYAAEGPEYEHVETKVEQVCVAEGRRDHRVVTALREILFGQKEVLNE